MNINEIENNHPAYGLISVNKFHGGTDKLFGQRKTDSGGITLEFFQGIIGNSFGNFTRISNDRTLIETHMTPEQWTSLLLNKDTENGTPVTIIYGPEGRVQELFHEDIVEGSQETAVFDDFEKMMSDKFQSIKKLEQESKKILNQEKITASDRKKLLENFKANAEKTLKEKAFFDKEIVDFITNVEETFKNKFVNDLKNNIFGDNETKLLVDKDTQIIDKDYMGVLVLRTINNAQGTLIKDFEADNGYSLTLYKARIVKNGNQTNIEKTNEVIIEVKMSSSQFSSFLVSFGGTEIPCSISTFDNKTVEPCLTNINDEVESIFKLYSFIDNIENEVKELEEEIIPLVAKNISKKNKDKISFVFEKLSRFTGSSLVFYSKDVFKKGLKFSLRRQEDVQAGVAGNIHKEGMKQLKNSKDLQNKLLK